MPRRVVACGLALGAVVLLASCPGGYSPPEDAATGRPEPRLDLATFRGRDTGGAYPDYAPLPLDFGADVGVRDGAGGVDGSSPVGCSASGVAAACDPYAATGCGAASCYLVGAVGPACVCPVGTKPEGGACSTTVECAPGYGCAGKVAPGACRRLCRVAAPQCAAGRTCRVVNAYPTWGLCAP